MIKVITITTKEELLPKPGNNHVRTLVTKHIDTYHIHSTLTSDFIEENFTKITNSIRPSASSRYARSLSRFC